MPDAICFAGQPDQFEGTLSALGVDVGDGDDVDAGNVARLGEVHGAVASGADEADADGAVLPLSVTEEFVEVHWISL